MNSGYFASGCVSQPSGSSTCAPRCIGRPQKRDRRSLRISSCLTYFVSFGFGSGSIVLSSVIVTVPPLRGLIVIVCGVL